MSINVLFAISVGVRAKSVNEIERQEYMVSKWLISEVLKRKIKKKKKTKRKQKEKKTFLNFKYIFLFIQENKSTYSTLI